MRPTGKLHLGNFVLKAGCDRQSHIDCGFGCFLNHFRYRVPENCFEITVLLIDGQKVSLGTLANKRAHVFLALQLLSRSLQLRKFGRRSAGEFELSDTDRVPGYAELKGDNRSAGDVGGAQIIGAAFDLAFQQQRLQCVGKLVYERSG